MTSSQVATVPIESYYRLIVACWTSPFILVFVGCVAVSGSELCQAHGPCDWPSFSVTNTCSTCSIVARSREHQISTTSVARAADFATSEGRQFISNVSTFSWKSYEIIIWNHRSTEEVTALAGFRVWQADPTFRTSVATLATSPHSPVVSQTPSRWLRDLCTFMYFPYSFNGMQYVMMQLMQYLFPTLCVFSVCCLHWELKISKYTFNIIRLSCPNCLTEPLLPSQTELQSVAKLLFEYVDACSCHRTCTIHCWQRICISPSDELWIIQPSAGWTSHQHDLQIWLNLRLQMNDWLLIIITYLTKPR